jgi:hypothetical protein
LSERARTHPNTARICHAEGRGFESHHPLLKPLGFQNSDPRRKYAIFQANRNFETLQVRSDQRVVCARSGSAHLAAVRELPKTRLLHTTNLTAVTTEQHDIV